MRKCALYLRVTPQDKPKTTSIEKQRRQLLNFAKKNGMKVVNVYQDEPIGVLGSASHLGEQASLGGLFDALEEISNKARWDFLLISSRDRLEIPRLSFSPSGELAKNGAKIYALGEKVPKVPKPKKSSPPRFSPNMTKEEKLAEGRRIAVSQGFACSGQTPYGYTRKRLKKHVELRVNYEEAAVISFIFKEYLRVRSLEKVLVSLNAKGARTRRGNPWSRASLSWALRNRIYLGRVTYGDISARGRHDPIVSAIIFNKAGALLRKNNKRGGRRRAS